MKRYAMTPIIGTGQGEDSYRPAVDDLSSVTWQALLPTQGPGDPSPGQPKYLFTFIRVASQSMGLVGQVQNTYLLPDYALDAKMVNMQAGERAALKADVAAYDMKGDGTFFLDTTSVDDDDKSYREVLTAIAGQIEPAFDPDLFDVGEPE